MGDVAAVSRSALSQLLTPLRWVEKFLPKGWGDFIRQLILVHPGGHRLRADPRAFAGSVQVAFIHARDLVSFERSIGIFTELDVQHWALHRSWALDIADFTYFHAHFAITVVFLFWLYLRRNRHYYFIRNAIFVADGIALVGFTLFPAAPPRFLTDLGFTDTLDRYAQINTYSDGLKQLTNPYAAVPSIHTCYSLITAITCFYLVTRKPVRFAFLFYPGADHLLDRGDRQPLLDRRHPGCAHRRRRAQLRMGDRALPPDPARQRPPAPASAAGGPVVADDRPRRKQRLIASVV